MKTISILTVCIMSACLLGCSKEKPQTRPVSEQEVKALKGWVAQQKWDSYECGKSVVSVNLGGRTAIVGIGVADIPDNPKLIAPNQKRTAMLAIRALSKEVEVESLDDVFSVVNVDISVSDGKKRRVAAFAFVK